MRGEMRGDVRLGCGYREGVGGSKDGRTGS